MQVLESGRSQFGPEFECLSGCSRNFRNDIAAQQRQSIEAYARFSHLPAMRERKYIARTDRALLSGFLWLVIFD